MNPEDLERELAAVTAGIHPPANAWSTIAQRGRVRRTRRLAVTASVAVAVLFAGGIAIASNQWRTSAPPPLAATTSPAPTVTPQTTATETPTPRPTASSPIVAGSQHDRFVAVMKGRVRLYEYGPTGYRVTRSLTPVAVSVHYMSLTPDRTELLYVVHSHCTATVWRVRLDGTHRTRVLSTQGIGIYGLELSPDGTLLAVAADTACGKGPTDPSPQNLEVRVLSMATGHVVWASKDRGDSVAGLSWDGNSTDLVFSYMYCCDMGYVLHRASIDPKHRSETTSDKSPTDCTWVYGAADVYAALCVPSDGDDQVLLGRSRSHLGPAVVKWGADTQPQLLRVSLSARGQQALVVIQSGTSDTGFAVLLADLVRGGPTTQVLGGGTDADW